MATGQEWIDQLHATIVRFQESRQLHDEVRVTVRFMDGFETNVRSAMPADLEHQVVLVPAPPLKPGQDLEDAFVLLEDGRYLRSSWLVVDVAKIMRVEIARERSTHGEPQPERKVGFYVDHDAPEPEPRRQA